MGLTQFENMLNNKYRIQDPVFPMMLNYLKAINKLIEALFQRIGENQCEMKWKWHMGGSSRYGTREVEHNL